MTSANSGNANIGAKSPQRAAPASPETPATPTMPESPISPSAKIITLVEGYYIPLSQFIINFALIALLFTLAVLFSTLNILWREAPWKIAIGVLIVAICLFVMVTQTIALLQHARKPL